MTTKIDKLGSLDNEKLIDVVKNFRQYGYDDNIRNAAIEILEDRGIDKEQLKLTGNFENQTYNSAKLFYDAFKRNSRITIIFYTLVYISAIFLHVLNLDSEPVTVIALAIDLILVLSYFLFFIKSFNNQIDFFRIIGKYPGFSSAVIYFLLGVPFYVFLYFYYRNRMKEELKLIN